MRLRRLAAVFKPDRASLIAGIVSSVSLYLAFPPVGLYWLTPVSIAALSWLVARTERPFSAGLWVSVFQLWVWLTWHWWVRERSLPGLFGMVPMLSAYAGVAVWAGAWLRRRANLGPALTALVFAGVFGALEFLRGEVILSGYDFYRVGNAMVEPGWARMLASWVGAAGVSTLVVLFGAQVGVMVARGWSLFSAVGAGCLAFMAGVAGVMGNRYEPKDWISVGLVQTNIPQDFKTGWGVASRRQLFTEGARLTAEAAADGSELIVWPESMFPAGPLNDEAAAVFAAGGFGLQGEDGGFWEFGPVRDAFLRAQAELGVPIVVGGHAIDGIGVGPDGRLDWEAEYNSAFVVEGGGVVDRYDKVRLVPFGEVVPHVGDNEWLEELILSLGVGAEGMSFGLDAGREARALELGSGERVAAPICFEITEAGYIRELVGTGDDRVALVVNLTNDGWFGGSDAGRRVHLDTARWRAAENGVSVARAANTGISALIGPTGEVVQVLPTRTDGVLVGSVPVAGDKATLFAMGGHWFQHWVWLAVGAAVVRSFSRRKVLDAPAADEADTRLAEGGE